MALLKNSGEMFYTDISSVLQRSNDGNEIFGNPYDMLLRVLADSDSEVSLVVHCLRDLEQCITLLNDEHATLIKIIMNLNWLDRGLELVSVYQSFMLNLVSAHMNYFKACLRMLVKKFTPDPKRTPVGADPAEVKMKVEKDSVHVHALLKSLSHLVPMMSVLMTPVLEDMFPYINKGVEIYESYCRNALAVCHYMPDLRLGIMELVIKNMLKLDVRASRKDINLVIGGTEEEVKEEDDDSDEEDMFEMEDMKQEFKSDIVADMKLEAGVKQEVDIKNLKLENNDRDTKPVQTTAVLEERLASELPVATSLDAAMALMFQFIRDVCFVNGKLDWTLTKTVYRELLSVFDKYIFLTHASCHVQFIMFYICSFREALSDGFLDYLWKKVMNPSSQSVHRQTATCYIGSLLTRAEFISSSTAREVIDLLVKWIHQYLDQTSDQQQSPDIAHHAAFYCVCQAVFYIFCFRHNEFLQLHLGHKWAESLNFQRIITSKLNPLRVCVPIVVKTFASISRMYQLAFCDTIIERNNRYSLPVASSSLSLPNSEELQLEAYFPFDPYLLPKSRHYIAPLYKQFSGSLPDEEEEETEDEDEDDFLPDEDDLQPRTDHLAMSLGKSPVDFLQYGTSPGFKFA